MKVFSVVIVYVQITTFLGMDKKGGVRLATAELISWNNNRYGLKHVYQIKLYNRNASELVLVTKLVGIYVRILIMLRTLLILFSRFG